MSNHYDTQRAELEAADLAAKTAGTLIGRYIEHPHADSYAVYKIVAVTRTKARIEVVEIDDAWVLPAWGRKAAIPLGQAQSFVERRDAMAVLFKQTDDWWDRQPIDAIVHYSNGHDQFVRGRIILHEGKHMMLPFALVGCGWRQSDLWTRSADGLRYGYHVSKIKNVEPFQPNASNMVEYPDHPRQYRKYRTHPCQLQPIDFNPPKETPAQSKLAEIAKLRLLVIAALEYDHTTDTTVLTATITASLKRAKKLLDGFNPDC